jgi:hypothetical protein
MSEILIRLVWLCAVSTAMAYGFFLLFGSLFAVHKQTPIVIQDALMPGKHTVSGIVMVPSPCTELTVQTAKLSPTTYTLELQTWEDPSVACQKIETPRSFNTVAFAPTFGIQFVVYLDGKTVPFQIIPVMPSEQAQVQQQP